MRNRAAIAALALWAAGFAPPTPAPESLLLETPAGERYARIDRQGETVLPIGRAADPHGTSDRHRPPPVRPRPLRGRLGAGDGQRRCGALFPHRRARSRVGRPQVTQIPPGAETDKRVINSAFLGAAVDTDARAPLRLGGRQRHRLRLPALGRGPRGPDRPLDPRASRRLHDRHRPLAGRPIPLRPGPRALPPRDHRHGEARGGGLGRGRSEPLRAGPRPRTVGRAFVANMGTFQYSFVETREPYDDLRGVAFPPTGYPSKEAREGTVVEGRRVPGLGDPNVDEACSVFILDLARPERAPGHGPDPTGLPVGQSIGGSSPAGLAASAETLFVTNSTNDTVEAYDLATRTAALVDAARARSLPAPPARSAAIRPRPFPRRAAPLRRGVRPQRGGDPRRGHGRGARPHPDRLVPGPARAVARTAAPSSSRTRRASARAPTAAPASGPACGPIPTPPTSAGSCAARSPSSRCRRDERLEARPRACSPTTASSRRPPSRPADHPLPELPGRPSPKIKHVVFITKENRTFDEVFGDLPGARGDPSLTRFGAGPQGRTLPRCGGHAQPPRPGPAVRDRATTSTWTPTSPRTATAGWWGPTRTTGSRP